MKAYLPAFSSIYWAESSDLHLLYITVPLLPGPEKESNNQISHKFQQMIQLLNKTYSHRSRCSAALQILILPHARPYAPQSAFRIPFLSSSVRSKKQINNNHTTLIQSYKLTNCKHFSPK